MNIFNSKDQCRLMKILIFRDSVFNVINVLQLLVLKSYHIHLEMKSSSQNGLSAILDILKGTIV